MRRLLSIAAVALAAAGALTARNALQGSPPKSEAEKRIIDLKSDLSGPVAPGDSVIFLVGNFAAQHNGAVITCDSAVRYSDKRLEFFGNVLINKNTTYIYGERAEYNGDLNEARVFSEIVKVVDGDATLYTYEFLFNTKSNIGRFDGGGVLINRDNTLESIRGFYYGDTKQLIAVKQVEMRNEEYELKGDSVIYNTTTDNAHFFTKTNIWSNAGDYLYADRGSYQKSDSLYIVTHNGYVLTETQEIWSDSIDFYRAKNHVIMRQDVQIDDRERKVLAFGDYGEYWKEPGDAFLTRRPAVVSYDASQGDSLFMRADSIYLFTLFTTSAKAADSLAALRVDSLLPVTGMQRDIGQLLSGDQRSEADSLAGDRRGVNRGSTEGAEGGGEPGDLSAQSDSLGLQRDSLGRALGVDSLASGVIAPADTVQLTPAERKAKLHAAARKAKEIKKAAAAKAKRELLAEIAVARQAKVTKKLLAIKESEEARLANRKLKAESKFRARQARAIRKGKPLPDSTAIQKIDSLLLRNAAAQDSLSQLLINDWERDSLEMFSPTDSIDSLAPLDSIYRLLKGFRNVRIYRSDFQSVCDSMTALSTDSTIHLYIDPVLWNQNNQITSDWMDIYTINQQLVRADFVGSPMMVSELDTLHYNQIAGKEMTAHFRNNEIYRNDVNGNARTLYYMQDGEPPVITGLFVIESGGISFMFEQKQIVEMIWRVNPVYNIYPMDKIPIDIDLYLKGFKWQAPRRPTQADVFDRRIRPSEREARMEINHPAFPLQKRINEHRKRLIEQRRWADRMDQVDPATVEWMLSLGFEVGRPREEQGKK